METLPTVLEPTSLVWMAEATRLLAECRTLEDVRRVGDLAESARIYAKHHHMGLAAQNHAGAVAVEAQIRRGEILKTMSELGERAGPGDGAKGSFSAPLPTLADLDTTKKEASDALAVAEQAEVVRDWMTTAKAITPRRAAEVARKATKPPPDDVPALPPSCDIRQGDFRIVLANMPDASVDLILTDPPYPAKYLDLWSDLGAFAKRVLKPKGMLAAMSGESYLPDVMTRLCEHLPYRWTMAYLVPGGTNVVHARRISTGWKPILLFGSTDRWLNVDVVRSEQREKEHHDWGQSESGMAAILQTIGRAGDVVCDPFLGGGTTAVVTLAAGYSFIGAEIDPDTYAVARRRLGR